MKDGRFELTEEEREYIIKGIRPVDMPNYIFKQVRKEMNRRIKSYLSGLLIWESSIIEYDLKIRDYKKVITNGTYIKKLGRILDE